MMSRVFEADQVQVPESAMESDPHCTAELQLLLVHADDHQSVLSSGPALESVLLAPRSSRPSEPTKFLFDEGGDPNDLPSQRWGLVVPEGPRGERLLEVLEPLIRHRAEQQGLKPEALKVFRVRPDLTGLEEERWQRDALDRHPHEQPRYLMLVGDAEDISFDLQKRLSVNRFVGRLTFPEKAGFEAYEAYVDKVLRSERSPATSKAARALFFTANDGSLATRVGRECLIAPSLAECREDVQSGVLSASEVLEVAYRMRGAREKLLEAAAQASPGVLLTLSHGLGPSSPEGWASAELQRQRQGTMSFGEGEALEPEEVSQGPFMPGGVWFSFACFSAGTPKRSAYTPWLRQLQKVEGRQLQGLAAVLASAPLDQRPFVATLPQAALANPEGPLAVMGHVDLAWTYAFQDPSGQNHASRFVDVIEEMLKHRRAGVALSTLGRMLCEVNEALAECYQRGAERRTRARSGSGELLGLAHLWMTRHDLAGYVLLGDPAVRLSLKDAREIPRILRSEQSQGSLEEAVLAWIESNEEPVRIAERYNISQSELRHGRAAYQEAGHEALRNLTRRLKGVGT